MPEAREEGYVVGDYARNRDELFRGPWGGRLFQGQHDVAIYQCKHQPQGMLVLVGGYPRADPVVTAHSPERKFIRLRDEWKSQRGHESSTVKLLMHPAYQKIIGMGSDAVPFLLRELEGEPDLWFWALYAITEQDPVAEGDRGDGEAMAQAWLTWGRDRGYQW